MWSRPVKHGERLNPFLTEKENEIGMKIDEVGRKGDSFHQQVYQMKPRDKSRCKEGLGSRAHAFPSVSCGRQAGR